MVDAICNELKIRKNYLSKNSIETIYFGGGTPSVLSEKELEKIFENLHQNFEINKDVEITLEANPDDLTDEKLRMFSESPINRLSIGIQSFDDEDLRLMNRSHNAAQAENCVKKAREFGFENISIDLIYAIPSRNDLHWKRQLQKAVSLDVPHISAYALTVEKETVLENWIRKGRLALVDEAAAERQFFILSENLQQAGYEHYEISNFAKPNQRARHNSNYWNGVAYLGVGPSAHSFDGHSRQWNISNNHLYLKSLQNKELNFEKENLSISNHFNEMIMTKLRTKEGLNLDETDKKFGAEFSEYLIQEATDFLSKGKLEMDDGNLKIPASQRFFSDGIASALFYV